MPSQLLLLEHWKPIYGFEDRYEVSNCGAIRSIRSGRMRKLAPDKFGYIRIGFYVEGKNRNYLAHSLVARAFLGERPIGLQINHKNGDKLCNLASNLEYVSQVANLRHSQILRLNPSWTMTDSNVDEIIKLRGTMTTRQIAALYGTTSSTVSRIHTGTILKLRRSVP